METHLRFVHWRDGEYFLGYLFDYPEYWTQGMSLEEHKENLEDLLKELARGDL